MIVGAVCGVLAVVFRLVAMADRDEPLWVDLSHLSVIALIASVAGALLLGQRTMLRRQEAVAERVSRLVTGQADAEREAMVRHMTDAIESSNAALAWSIDATLLQLLEGRSDAEDRPPPTE